MPDTNPLPVTVRGCTESDGAIWFGFRELTVGGVDEGVIVRSIELLVAPLGTVTVTGRRCAVLPTLTLTASSELLKRVTAMPSYLTSPTVTTSPLPPTKPVPFTMRLCTDA